MHNPTPTYGAHEAAESHMVAAPPQKIAAVPLSCSAVFLAEKTAHPLQYIRVHVMEVSSRVPSPKVPAPSPQIALGVCYQAPWRLPGPDLHRLVNTSLHETASSLSITSYQSGPFSGHASKSLATLAHQGHAKGLAQQPRHPGPRRLGPW